MRLLRAYLAWHAAVIGAAGLALLALPARDLTSRSLSAVYSLAGPRQWGVLFVAVAVACAIAVGRVTWQRPALIGLVVGEVGWAIGLAWPLFASGHTNVLAPLAWLGFAGTAAIVIYARRHDELWT